VRGKYTHASSTGDVRASSTRRCSSWPRSMCRYIVIGICRRSSVSMLVFWCRVIGGRSLVYVTQPVKRMLESASVRFASLCVIW